MLWVVRNFFKHDPVTTCTKNPESLDGSLARGGNVIQDHIHDDLCRNESASGDGAEDWKGATVKAALSQANAPLDVCTQPSALLDHTWTPAPRHFAIICANCA